jgi:hypothetical protein
MEIGEQQFEVTWGKKLAIPYLNNKSGHGGYSPGNMEGVSGKIAIQGWPRGKNVTI